jgi:hypothetical protein
LTNAEPHSYAALQDLASREVNYKAVEADDLGHCAARSRVRAESVCPADVTVNELIAVRGLQNHERSPIRLLRLPEELDTAGLELGVGGVDLVACQGVRS